MDCLFHQNPLWGAMERGFTYGAAAQSSIEASGLAATTATMLVEAWNRSSPNPQVQPPPKAVPIGGVGASLQSPIDLELAEQGNQRALGIL